MRTFFLFLLVCCVMSFIMEDLAHTATDTPWRDPVVMGTGSAKGGYMGTYIDPQTGDKVTAVIAPPQNQNTQQNMPVVIYPPTRPHHGMSSSGTSSSGTPSYEAPSYGVMPIPSTETAQ